MKIIAIVAMDENRVIGADGGIPWHYPEDMKRFAALTKGHTVVMGRKTYESLPPKFRPLPERRNIVISSTLKEVAGIEIFSTIKAALDAVNDGTIWIIGGGKIYEEALPYCNELQVTRVPGVHAGDTYFPPFLNSFRKVESIQGEKGILFERYISSTLAFP